MAVFSLNAMDFFPLLHATHRINGIVTLISASATASELESQLRCSSAVALFTCAPLLQTALRAARAVSIPDDSVFLLPVPGFDSASRLSTDGLIAEAETLPPVASPRWSEGQGARQTAYLCFSSGTSGLPKAVMISHRNVIANILQLSTAEAPSREALAFTTETVLGVLPFSHVFGLIVCGLLSQYRGDEVVVLPRWHLDSTLAAVQRHSIRRLLVVPPMLVQMAAARERLSSTHHLSSVRWILSGAAPLGTELADKLLRLFPEGRLGQGYGLSESATAVTINSETENLVGSSGPLLPGMRAKLVDAAGERVTGYDQPGELFLQSPSLALGYLDNEKATAETFVWHDDGRWLRTGDEVLVRKSDSGRDHFFITDRIKELIKVKGHQVAPAELEAHLLGHPLVSDCAVIAAPDETSGEVPKAFVVKAEEATGTSDGDIIAALGKHFRDHKASYKALRGGVRFVDSIPKSPSGKILRRLLRDDEDAKMRSRVSPSKL
ncbi:AMP dependent CoA ligase [Ophiocordyceps camponoti-floridani]|uniref:AMP dependent CoA ligase n=1 Tax=Ophiocordyceps camponoti-floridani TaxID=2030778 RepID=A0A8H4Q2R2_9HYPO|nr:AMP dependent CoA ligase [Ophiocordyceps camponoti-floridani]